MTVHLGNRSVELIHPGPAHTFGDTLVYLPEEKIIFTGDVAFQYLVPLAADGHVSNWIKVTKHLRNDMDIETMVTGHGPVAKKEAIGWTHRYFKALKKHCKEYFRLGKSPDDAAADFLFGRARRLARAGKIVYQRSTHVPGNAGRLLRGAHRVTQVKAPFFRARRLGHANLFVTDVERSLDFYNRVVGIEEVYRKAAPTDLQGPAVGGFSATATPTTISPSSGTPPPPP